MLRSPRHTSIGGTTPARSTIESNNARSVMGMQTPGPGSRGISIINFLNDVLRIWCNAPESRKKRYVDYW